MSYTHDLDVDLYEIQNLNDAIVAIDTKTIDKWHRKYGDEAYLYTQIEKAFMWSEKKHKVWNSRQKWTVFVERWLQRQVEFRKKKR